MPYISNTEKQQQEMLADIGMTSEELFAAIPQDLVCEKLNLPEGLSEQEITEKFNELAAKNNANLVNFIGGGFYDHYIPAAVGQLVSKTEFYTAYTPYQPETSQGTLQAIYEYQTSICRLTDMEVSNASLYDGGTGLYESVMMAVRITGKKRVIMDNCVNPIYRNIVRSYVKSQNIEIVEIDPLNGSTNREAVIEALKAEKSAAVVVSNPNFFGVVEDFTDLAETVHENKALFLMSCYPTALGVLKTPGQMGADIVTGEGQSLGLPLNFGGPYLGFMATTKKHMRKMPGRICGRTKDSNGKDGFVLTLQAREQHIRREKATSNICTNEGLCALSALVYLSLMGKQGLREVCTASMDNAAYAAEKLASIPGVSLKFADQPFFNEFVLELPCPANKVIPNLLANNIAAGFPLTKYYNNMENCLLVAFTEKRTQKQIDELAKQLEAAL